MRSKGVFCFFLKNYCPPDGFPPHISVASKKEELNSYGVEIKDLTMVIVFAHNLRVQT